MTASSTALTLALVIGIMGILVAAVSLPAGIALIAGALILCVVGVMAE